MSKKYRNYKRLPVRYSVTQLGGACPESDDSVAPSAAAAPSQSEDRFCGLNQTDLASQLRLKFRIEAPCPALAGLKRDRESSKCKEVIPFYCSSLANPVRLRRTTGNALAEAFSMTKTKDRFGICDFGHCDLFDICDL